MNHDFSQLSLSELCDKLSECTSVYSKSRRNAIPEKEFTELMDLMDALQKEIAKRKSTRGDDDPPYLFPPHQSASA